MQRLFKNLNLIWNKFKKSNDSFWDEVEEQLILNDVGKTSTIAKIANLFKNQSKSILLTAADTYRAAAFEQIDHYAKLLNIEIVHHQRYSDPGAVVYDSIEKAIAKKIDLVLIDTAGRMHTAYNLMEELKKIKKVIYKKLAREADEILMVIDST